VVNSLFTRDRAFNFAAWPELRHGLYRLKPLGDRAEPELSVFALADAPRRSSTVIRDAQVFAFAPPAVMELGNPPVFQLFLQDMPASGSWTTLYAQRVSIARNGRTTSRAGRPRCGPMVLKTSRQYQLDRRRLKSPRAWAVLIEVNSNPVHSLGGSSYVNVLSTVAGSSAWYLQVEASARMGPDDLGKWYLSQQQRRAVPFNAIDQCRVDLRLHPSSRAY